MIIWSPTDKEAKNEALLLADSLLLFIQYWKVDFYIKWIHPKLVPRICRYMQRISSNKLYFRIIFLQFSLLKSYTTCFLKQWGLTFLPLLLIYTVLYYLVDIASSLFRENYLDELKFFPLVFQFHISLAFTHLFIQQIYLVSHLLLWNKYKKIKLVIVTRAILSILVLSF